MGDSVRIIKVDVDKNPATQSSALNVQGVPTLGICFSLVPNALAPERCDPSLPISTNYQGKSFN